MNRHEWNKGKTDRGRRYIYMGRDAVSCSVEELGRHRQMLLDRVDMTIERKMLDRGANVCDRKIKERWGRRVWILKFYQSRQDWTDGRVVKLCDNQKNIWARGKNSKEDVEALKGDILFTGEWMNLSACMVRWRDNTCGLRKVSWWRERDLVVVDE